MKAITYILLTATLLLAACATLPAPGDNETAPGYTPIITPIGGEPGETPEEPLVEEEPTLTEPEEPVEEPTEQPVEEPTNLEYAATIEATEGDTIQLDTTVSDPDGDEVQLTFDPPFNSEGMWETEVGDVGEYEVRVVASDGDLETEAYILVSVLSANKAPTIEGPTRIVLEEGEAVDLGVFTITDPDNDEFVTSYSGWMRASEYTTGFNDAGTHEVTIIAEDEQGNEARFTVEIVVENVNREPTILIDELRMEAVEGDLVTIEVATNDPDGDELELRFSEPFDDNGEWQTEIGDAGDYRVDVTVTDGAASVKRTVRVDVLPQNQAPVIDVAARIVVEEGDTIDFGVLADIEDPDGDAVEVSYGGWMNTERYTTDFDDAGEHEVTITATDGENTNSVTVTVVVENVNRPPVFNFG